MKRIIALVCLCCTIAMQAAAQTWIGTWATAPQTVVKSFMPYNNNMTNRSVRQVVKVSVGGDVIRLKLSNIYSMQPVEIRSVYIAHAKDSSDIDAKSAQYFKFGNSYKATIPAGKQLVSDALKFPNCKYRPDVIHYDYAPQKARFYDSNPGEFFIFFPRDWHIAKVATDGEDQAIRVIVIKVDYKD